MVRGWQSSADDFWFGRFNMYDEIWDDVIIDVDIMDTRTGEIHTLYVDALDYPNFLRSFREQSYGFKLV